MALKVGSLFALLDLDSRPFVRGLQNIDRLAAQVKDVSVMVGADRTDFDSDMAAVDAAVAGVDDANVAVLGDATDALGAISAVESGLEIEDESVLITGSPEDALSAIGSVESQLAAISDQSVLITGDATDALGAISAVESGLAGIQDESVAIQGTTSGMFDEMGVGASSAGAAMGGLAGSAGMVKGVVAGLVALPVIGFLGSATTASMELADAQNATNVIFGESAGIIDTFAAKSVSGAGLSEDAFRKLAAPLGGLLSSLGIVGDEAANMTIDVTKLGADLASIYGGDVSTAVAAVGGLFRGETEPARAFGIAIDQAAINARALEMGLVAEGEELTKNAKAQATYALLMEQTAAVQGDWNRTQDEGVNATRKAAAAFEDAKAGLGESLAPAMVMAAGLATKLFEAFNALPGPVQTAILVAGGLAAVLIGLGLVVGPLSAGLGAIGIGGGAAAVGTGAAGVAATGASVGFWAMLAPLAPILLAIAAVIAIGVLLVKNWDTVKAVAVAVWFFVRDLIGSVAGWIGDRIQDIIGFVGRVISKFFELRDRVGDVIAAVIDWFGNLALGIATKVGDLIGFVTGIPGKIRDVFAGAREWLVDAGRSIIIGLIVGMAKMYVRLKEELNKVTSWIPQWKGPASVDRQLLYDNGVMIMQGFERGLESEFAAVERMLGGLMPGVSVAAGGSAGGSAGGYGTGGGVRPIVINVAGSVVTERDLARTIDSVIRQRSYLSGRN